MQPTTPSDVPDAPEPAPHRRRRLRRFLIGAAVLLVLSLVGLELFARYKLGLGDPPLSLADPEIEYLFKPSATYHRFGNTIHYNAYSMRSDDFPKHKTNPDEFRVMVVGDSVINGGALTDQRDLATTLLQARLSDLLHRPVIVGNISAGSWGPPNQAAYLKRYGLFDADVLLMVFSSHDYADAPTFEPVVGVSSDMPARKPFLAMEELFMRYLPIYFVGRPHDTGFPSGPATEKDIDWCKQSIRDMVQMARAAGAEPLIAQHLNQAELPGQEEAGHRVIEELARELNVPTIQLGSATRWAAEPAYRDYIHLNPHGQHVIADVLLPHLLKIGEKRGAATRPSATVGRSN